MIARLSTLVRVHYPFNWQILGIGAAIGVSKGLIQLLLGESVDLATAAGIASFVAVTVGGWLGRELVQLYLSYAGRQIAAMNTRLEALRGSEAVPLEQETETERSLVRRVWVWCLVRLPLYLLGIAPLAVLHALLEPQVGLNDFRFWNPFAVSLGVVILVIFSVHRVYFWRLKHQIGSLEQAQGTKIPLSQLAQQTQYWQRLVRTIPKWFERITGLSTPQLERGRSEGFPGTAA
jgi:hypothetical protein